MLLIPLLLFGCAHRTAMTADQHAFCVDAVFTEAWFIIDEHPEEKAALDGYAEKAPLVFRGAWESLNPILQQLPRDQRDEITREALKDVRETLLSHDQSAVSPAPMVP